MVCLPPSLITLLEHKEVTKAGVGIEEDVKRLARGHDIKFQVTLSFHSSYYHFIGNSCHYTAPTINSLLTLSLRFPYGHFIAHTFISLLTLSFHW
jgi:hypothetical protein